VHHLVLRAEVGVLVEQRVEAVRAGRDDALRLVVVERRDVGLGEHHVEVLVARAPRRVAGAGLLAAEDGEVDLRLLHQPRHGAGDLLGAVVVAGRAADPVEHRRVGLLAHQLHVEAVGPLRPVHAREVPGVAVGLEGLEGLLKLRRKLAPHHHQVAAHVDDLVDVGDHHRALLLAGAAGGARPDDVGVDDVGHEVEVEDGLRRFAVLAVGVVREDLLLLGVEVVAQVDGEVLRGEQLARAVRRAVVRAAAALGAGVEVEEGLPGEVVHAAHADAGGGGVGLLHRGGHVLEQLVRALGHGLEPAGRVEVAREDVGQRRDDVEVLAVGQVVEEGEDQEDVHPHGG